MKTPEQRARELAQCVSGGWDQLTSASIDPRKEILRSLTVDSNGAIQSGLPGIYLNALAHEGDTSAHDLMVEIGMSPGIARPKRQGGRTIAGMRAFVVHVLTAQLMQEFTELSFGANDATDPATSAVDLIRQALEDEGIACVDYKNAGSSGTDGRAMERAIRRMYQDPKYRELFDPAWP